jgi:hypothetical protein
MLDKRKRGVAWWTWTAILNVLFIGYLITYTGGGGEGQFIGNLPEAFVVLSIIVGLAFVTHSMFAWYYLGKPDLSQLYTPEKPTKDDNSAAERSEGRI